MEKKNPRTLLEAMRHFDPETAQAYIEAIKWPDGPCCPKCGSIKVGRIVSRNRLQCRERECRCQFSLMTGTIFEATHLRLDQWIAAVWMIANCRNGVSSCEIARTIGCKQQSAWHLLHRIRHILQQDKREQMGQRFGVVESDTTYVGGEFKFMSYERRERARKSERPHDKSVVHAIRERRSGKVRAAVVPNPPKNFVRHDIVENVAPFARVYTDSARSYGWLPEVGYRHESVNHNALEYARGTVHVNGCENFFNCLRRTIGGCYIATSPDHLHAYVDEQVWRFNVRELSDWERFDKAMRLIVGKRLTYSELTGGSVR
jgi:transposase-like protein